MTVSPIDRCAHLLLANRESISRKEVAVHLNSSDAFVKVSQRYICANVFTSAAFMLGASAYLIASAFGVVPSRDLLCMGLMCTSAVPTGVAFKTWRKLSEYEDESLRLPELREYLVNLSNWNGKNRTRMNALASAS